MVAGFVVLGAVASGVAIAAGVQLPFSGDGNTINGCYEASSGTFKMLTPTTPKCSGGWKAISCNQTGPPGVSGYETVLAKVSHDADQEATAIAVCPTGKTVIGGGASITGIIRDENGKIPVIVLSLPSGDAATNTMNVWAATAIAPADMQGDWGVAARVLCAYVTR